MLENKENNYTCTWWWEVKRNKFHNMQPTSVGKQISSHIANLRSRLVYSWPLTHLPNSSTEYQRKRSPSCKQTYASQTSWNVQKRVGRKVKSSITARGGTFAAACGRARGSWHQNAKLFILRGALLIIKRRLPQDAVHQNQPQRCLGKVRHSRCSSLKCILMRPFLCIRLGADRCWWARRCLAKKCKVCARARVTNAERRVCYSGAWIQSTRTQVSALPHLHLVLRFDGRLCVTAPAPNHRFIFGNGNTHTCWADSIWRVNALSLILFPSRERDAPHGN